MRTYLLVLALLPAPILAACPAGEAEVFTCKTDTKKEVHVCQGKDTISYRYGKPGQPPEIVVPEKNATFHWGHSEGTGGRLDDLYFRRGQVAYVLSYQGAPHDPDNQMAHLAVEQPGRPASYRQCEERSIHFNPEAIKATPREVSDGAPSL